MNNLSITLDNPARYVNLGPLTISIPNLFMFSLILLLFFTPMIVGSVNIRKLRENGDGSRTSLESAAARFISTWRIVNNSVTLAALIVVFATGILMASRGLSWLYASNVSHFVHGLHFWSVQILFVSIILHFMFIFWRSAWKGRRFAMWASGVIAFFTCMFTAYTGGLVASSLNSQWIALQSKNVFNAIGVGSLFNPLNVGQMLTLHIAIFPIVVASLTVWHIAVVQQRFFRLPWTPSANLEAEE